MLDVERNDVKAAAPTGGLGRGGGVVVVALVVVVTVCVGFVLVSAGALGRLRLTAAAAAAAAMAAPDDGRAKGTGFGFGFSKRAAQPKLAVQTQPKEDKPQKDYLTSVDGGQLESLHKAEPDAPKVREQLSNSNNLII